MLSVIKKSCKNVRFYKFLTHPHVHHTCAAIGGVKEGAPMTMDTFNTLVIVIQATFNLSVRMM